MSADPKMHERNEEANTKTGSQDELLFPDIEEEAEASAQRARERGVALVRNHLQSHLKHNPDSTFVTWVATLHPENAQITIDPRFDIPKNPWRAVYEEVTQNLKKPASKVQYAEQGVAVDSEKIPTATVVAVLPVPSAPILDEDARESNADQISEPETERHSSAKGFSGLMDLLIGGTLIICSAIATFMMELIAAFLYFSTWICAYIAQACSTPHITCCSVLPFIICLILKHIFQCMEVVLLLVSVILIESMAFVGLLFCTIFSLSWCIGRTVHQRIRKVGHVTRWAFRRPFRSWSPPPAHILRFETPSK